MRRNLLSSANYCLVSQSWHYNIVMTSALNRSYKSLDNVNQTSGTQYVSSLGLGKIDIVNQTSGTQYVSSLGLGKIDTVNQTSDTLM